MEWQRLMIGARCNHVTVTETSPAAEDPRTVLTADDVYTFEACTSLLSWNVG